MLWRRRFGRGAVEAPQAVNADEIVEAFCRALARPRWRPVGGIWKRLEVAPLEVPLVLDADEIIEAFCRGCAVPGGGAARPEVGSAGPIPRGRATSPEGKETDGAVGGPVRGPWVREGEGPLAAPLEQHDTLDHFGAVVETAAGDHSMARRTGSKWR